jgi:hypothetical protein
MIEPHAPGSLYRTIEAQRVHMQGRLRLGNGEYGLHRYGRRATACKLSKLGCGQLDIVVVNRLARECDGGQPQEGK